MRRIYKTTTAVVASLSLIAPQLAMAQQQPANDAQGQLVVPKRKAEPGQDAQPQATKPKAEPAENARPAEPGTRPGKQQPAAQAQEKAAQPQAKPAPKAEPRAKAADTPSKAPARAQQAAEPQAKPRAAKPQAAEPHAEQAPALKHAGEASMAPGPSGDGGASSAGVPAPKGADAPKDQPAKGRPAAPPVEKPAVTQGAAPATKPADAPDAAARTQKLESEAQKQPAEKPDTPAAVTTRDAAPASKPAGAPPVQAERPAKPADAAALKKALQKHEDQARPNPGAETGAPARKPQQDGKPTPDAAALKKALEGKQDPQQAQGQQPAPPQTPAAAAADQPKPGQQQAAQPQPRQPQPGQPQPGEIAAPEAQSRPNAVAERAAEQVPPAVAAALAEGQAAAERGEVEERRITRDNARRSSEDFLTSVTQGIQPGREARESEARDDKDDTLKDIGKLLLAGAAGMAVGKMLSNDRQVALNTGDRVVVTLPDGSQQVIKDDNALLYQPGSDVRTETFQDGSTRTTVLREDGSRVVTIRDANMNILRRSLVRADGSETRLIDDTAAQPVQISTLPAPPPVRVSRDRMDEAALREALRREAAVDRRFTLGQIRDIPEVRALVAPVNVPEITFDTGSSAITPGQAEQLATLGKVIRDSIDQNPREVYMIEGYTDAVGSNAANLALSDRRAESVALALTEYFQVPPENMVVQGYGEQFLLVPSGGAERENRRVAVRRITDLLEQQ